MTNLATLLVGFGMFGSFILIPQLAEAPTSTGYGFGLDATGAGLLMLPGALVMLVAGPLSGVLGTRFGNSVPLALGASSPRAGLLLMALAHGTQVEIIVLHLVMFDRHRARLRRDAEPDHRGGPARGDRRGDRRQRARALGRRVARRAGHADVLAGSIAAGAVLPSSSGYTYRVRRLGGRRRRRRARRRRDPAREPARTRA